MVSGRRARRPRAETRVERRGGAASGSRFARCDDAIRMSSDEPSASLAPRDRRSPRRGAGAPTRRGYQAQHTARLDFAEGLGRGRGADVVASRRVVGGFFHERGAPTTRLADWVCLTLARAREARTLRRDGDGVLPTRTSRWEERSALPWTMRCGNCATGRPAARRVASRAHDAAAAILFRRIASLSRSRRSPRVRTPPSRPSAETSLSADAAGARARSAPGSPAPPPLPRAFPSPRRILRVAVRAYLVGDPSAADACWSPRTRRPAAPRRPPVRAAPAPRFRCAGRGPRPRARDTWYGDPDPPRAREGARGEAPGSAPPSASRRTPPRWARRARARRGASRPSASARAPARRGAAREAGERQPGGGAEVPAAAAAAAAAAATTLAATKETMDAGAVARAADPDAASAGRAAASGVPVLFVWKARRRDGGE